MTKFKVGDKVRVLSTDGEPLAGFENGDIVEIISTRVNNGGERRYEVRLNDGTIGYGGNDTFELISDKPTKKQRLSDAEKRIAELEAKVEALELKSSEINVLQAQVAELEKAQKPTIKFGEGTLHISTEMDISKIAQKLTEVIGGDKLSLTPNEQRKAIIAEAKAFVAEQTKPNTCDDGWNDKGAISYGNCGVIPNFHVNTEKRTVALILNGASSGTVRGKFFAKCAPDDVFNADIGKAIALGRALGLDVERFEQAVKPTEVVVGQTIEVIITSGIPSGMMRKVEGVKLGAYGNSNGKYPKYAGGWCSEFRITDDTDAQY